MTSKLIKCTCSHEDQDKMYGQGNRMANEARTGQYRCTVCGTLHGSAQSFTPVVKAKEPEPAKKVEKKVPAKKAEKKVTTKGEPKSKSAEKKKSVKGGKR